MHQYLYYSILYAFNNHSHQGVDKIMALGTIESLSLHNIVERAFYLMQHASSAHSAQAKLISLNGNLNLIT